MRELVLREFQHQTAKLKVSVNPIIENKVKRMSVIEKMR